MFEEYMDCLVVSHQGDHNDLDYIQGLYTDWGAGSVVDKLNYTYAGCSRQFYMGKIIMIGAFMEQPTPHKFIPAFHYFYSDESLSGHGHPQIDGASNATLWRIPAL